MSVSFVIPTIRIHPPSDSQSSQLEAPSEPEAAKTAAGFRRERTAADADNSTGNIPKWESARDIGFYEENSGYFDPHKNGWIVAMIIYGYVLFMPFVDLFLLILIIFPILDSQPWRTAIIVWLIASAAIWVALAAFLVYVVFIAKIPSKEADLEAGEYVVVRNREPVDSKEKKAAANGAKSPQK